MFQRASASDENQMASVSEKDESVRNSDTSFAVLRRFVRQRAAVERCELCSAELATDHEHLVEPSTRHLLCACQACSILFSGKANTRYRRAPRLIRYLSNFQLTDAQWDGLLIPISMAFFFNNSVTDKVIALYPSPAGATESLLDFESWNEILERNPVLKEMETDTEALLINRVRGASEYYLLPIDECYKLVGLIRTHWHGLSGGTQMWEAIGSFFAELKEKAKTHA